MSLNITWNTPAQVSNNRRGFAPSTVGGTAAGAVVGTVLGGMTGFGMPAQLGGAVLGGLGGGWVGSEVAASAPERAAQRAEAVGSGFVRGVASEAAARWNAHQQAQAQQAQQAQAAALPGAVAQLEQHMGGLYNLIGKLADKVDKLALPAAAPAPAPAQPAPAAPATQPNPNPKP